MYSDSDMDLSTSEEEEVKKPIAKKPAVEQKLLLAIDERYANKRVFDGNNLQEAKHWLQVQYNRPSLATKNCDDYIIEELVPGKQPIQIYAYDKKDFYTAEQLQFVAFMIECNYIKKELEENMLETLKGSKFDVRLKVEPTKKKQKTAKN